MAWTLLLFYTHSSRKIESQVVWTQLFYCHDSRGQVVWSAVTHGQSRQIHQVVCHALLYCESDETGCQMVWSEKHHHQPVSSVG